MKRLVCQAMVVWAVLVLCTGVTTSVAGAAGPAQESLGDKVVAYCRKHKGEQVGNGECAVLAEQALRAAGAKARGGKDAPDAGDYVWGTQVYLWEAAAGGPKGEGKRGDIKTGDIIQFRNAKWFSRQGNRTQTETMPHHTAIVASVEDGGATIHLLHQNMNGKKFVGESTLHLGDLKEGWIRVYEPIGRGE